MLTPTGAQLLRDVRDHIVAHPETFDWAEWCGTQCCIAGHVLRRAGVVLQMGQCAAEEASNILEVGCEDVGALYYGVFYGYETSHADGMDVRYDIPHAVQCINDFLWRYGFPPQAIVTEPAGLALPQAVEK